MNLITVTSAPHLSGFLLAHSAFRAEFGLLARVVASPRDAAHAALIEDQIDFLLGYLHHHHTDEDVWLWPLLRARAPHAEPVLDALEQQHQDIDPQVAVAADRGRPAAERARALRRLDEMINRHLDDEERIAVPLVLEHITAAEWNAQGEEVVRSYDRERVPTLFGWTCAHGDPAMVRLSMPSYPLPVRVLFRLVWWPRYRRRHELLYGAPLRRRADRES